jgi:hypothetical protein
MSIRRLLRKIKPLAEKGKPGTPYRHLEMRAFLTKRGYLLRGFNPTKGWRNFAK